MASEAQVVANRCNAQKSTGPRTPEGKAAVAQNAVKHGLLARQAVIAGEDPGEYEFYRDQMVGELGPVGLVESMLAERVVSLSWRLRRAERLQNEAFDALYLKETAGPIAKLTRSLHPKPAECGRSEDDLALGRVVLHGFSNDRVLDRLMMYERRIELSLYKAMAELRQQRLLRELDGPAQEPVCGVWGERPRSPKSVVRGRTTYEEAPAGVTTNTPPAEGPHHSNIPSFQDSKIPSFQHSTHEDLSCQTKPISAGRDAERPLGREATADSAKQSQFAEQAGGEPAADCAKQSQYAGPGDAAAEADRAKQSQSGGARTNRRAGNGVCEPMRTAPNKANSHGRSGLTAAGSTGLARG